MSALAIADDHTLLRHSLTKTLESFGHSIVVQAANGEDMISQLQQVANKIDLVLLDIVMPVKNGFDTCEWIANHYPFVKVIALSMNDDETSILKMLRLGARSFISKDAEPEELKKAIDDVINTGYYYNSKVTGKMVYDAKKNKEADSLELSAREKEFLYYNCSELTYKEIAQKMFLSPRSVENHRDTLFEKFQVKSRLALALTALRKGLVKL